jgi:hypothetical protein
VENVFSQGNAMKGEERRGEERRGEGKERKGAQWMKDVILARLNLMATPRSGMVIWLSATNIACPTICTLAYCHFAFPAYPITHIVDVAPDKTPS